MARITVEDCLRRVKNRFMLVHAAAKRVRQIREGAQYLVHSPKNEDIVIALRELGAGRVKVEEEELEEAAAETEEEEKEEEKEPHEEEEKEAENPDQD